MLLWLKIINCVGCCDDGAKSSNNLFWEFDEVFCCCVIGFHSENDQYRWKSLEFSDLNCYQVFCVFIVKFNFYKLIL